MVKIVSSISSLIYKPIISQTNVLSRSNPKNIEGLISPIEA